jgi:16S rRNA processing protein RimM
MSSLRNEHNRERLLPYLPGQYVHDIDLASGVMRVEWDPEF